MIPVNIFINDIRVKDIDHGELFKIYNLLNESPSTQRLLGKNEDFKFEEIRERYLESLSSISDFFLGVYLKDEIIGIIKGRFEMGSKVDVWFLTYILGEKHRRRGLGSTVLKEVEDFFNENYLINRFCVLAYENSAASINFWSKNEYKLLRKTSIKHGVEAGDILMLEKRNS